MEVLVHCKSGRNIKRGTLDGWLNCDEIEELECELIRPGARKHHTTDPTVQRFYAETALQDDVAAGAGKRIRVIHLGTEEVKKAGRPKGSTKAAAAASAAASSPADAAAGAGPGFCQRRCEARRRSEVQSALVRFLCVDPSFSQRRC